MEWLIEHKDEADYREIFEEITEAYKNQRDSVELNALLSKSDL